MVGDGPEADAATLEFCAYWEDNAALSGGVLVYNTGRSLGQFLGLWQSKAGALALPDVLITAVGTKVRSQRHTLMTTKCSTLQHSWKSAEQESEPAEHVPHCMLCDPMKSTKPKVDSTTHLDSQMHAASIDFLLNCMPSEGQH